MIEGLFSIVPIELKPMSIISLILIMVLAGVIRINMTTVKTLKEENESSIKLLKKELEETKKDLDKAKDHLNDQIKDLVLDLKVDVAGLKGLVNSVSSSISNIKTDIRDLRKGK